MPGNSYWPYDDKRETGTSCDNWNDQSNTKQGETARKGDGWTNKVTECRMIITCSKNDEGSRYLEDHERQS